MTAGSRRSYSFSSIFRLDTRRIWPIRSDRLRCAAASGEPNLSHAKRHRDIVRRFGRFPHRNPILMRTMSPEEQQFLDEGGYSG